MTDQPPYMVLADLLENGGVRVWDHVEAALSEGHCPHCSTHLDEITQLPDTTPIVEQVGDNPDVTASGYCPPCDLQWAAGITDDEHGTRTQFLAARHLDQNDEETVSDATLTYFRTTGAQS